MSDIKNLYKTNLTEMLAVSGGLAGLVETVSGTLDANLKAFATEKVNEALTGTISGAYKYADDKSTAAFNAADNLRIAGEEDLRGEFQLQMINTKGEILLSSAQISAAVALSAAALDGKIETASGSLMEVIGELAEKEEDDIKNLLSVSGVLKFKGLAGGSPGPGWTSIYGDAGVEMGDIVIDRSTGEEWIAVKAAEAGARWVSDPDNAYRVWERIGVIALSKLTGEYDLRNDALTRESALESALRDLVSTSGSFLLGKITDEVDGAKTEATSAVDQINGRLDHNLSGLQKLVDRIDDNYNSIDKISKVVGNSSEGLSSIVDTMTKDLYGTRGLDDSWFVSNPPGDLLHGYIGDLVAAKTTYVKQTEYNTKVQTLENGLTDVNQEIQSLYPKIETVKTKTLSMTSDALGNDRIINQTNYVNILQIKLENDPDIASDNSAFTFFKLPHFVLDSWFTDKQIGAHFKLFVTKKATFSVDDSMIDNYTFMDNIMLHEEKGDMGYSLIRGYSGNVQIHDFDETRNGGMYAIKYIQNQQPEYYKAIATLTFDENQYVTWIFDVTVLPGNGKNIFVLEQVTASDSTFI